MKAQGNSIYADNAQSRFLTVVQCRCEFVQVLFEAICPMSFIERLKNLGKGRRRKGVSESQGEQDGVATPSVPPPGME